MINNKDELKYYISADLISSGKKSTLMSRLKDPILRYKRVLRIYEYYLNCKSNGLARIIRFYYRYRFHVLTYSLGIQIPPNVFGPGLAIVHHQGIVVSANAKVGKNCRVHAGVNIGEWRGKAPVIGDNVYIGPGAKLIGGIQVGDRCVIGANAVVCKDVPSDVTVAGVPAKIISNKNSSGIIINPLA
jgi:serine O-acetyltransferase